MSQEELLSQIERLQHEIRQLKQQTVFSDIQPYIAENSDKYKKLVIAGIDLQYLVRFGKAGILNLLMERVASDLMQDPDNVQLLHPTKGTVLSGNEDFAQFETDGVFHLDFQYANACNHDHDHDHGDGGGDDDEDLSDDENFYNSCSCSHQH